MKLDLTSLRKALSDLEESLGHFSSELAKDPSLRRTLMSACIQSFEFTFELAIKLMKRQLELILPSQSNVDHMLFMDLIRSAAEAGLIDDVARYRTYREKRNITSHTYDQAKAEEIMAVLPDFRDDVRRLLAELERKNRDD